jgi:hypothetical protein
MSPSKRYAKKQAKARQRRLYAHERLERDKRQAQRAAAEALHQALQELGLPEDLVAEIEGRLRSQHKLLGKIIGVMFPALLAVARPQSYVVCGAGTSMGPRACSGHCRTAPGSSGCGAWGWRCLSPSGVMCMTKARPPRAAGSGPGSGITRCPTSMVRSCGWSAGGGAASTSGCCRALMGSCWWWSWAMAAWSCRSIVPWGIASVQGVWRPDDSHRCS